MVGTSKYQTVALVLICPSKMGLSLRLESHVIEIRLCFSQTPPQLSGNFSIKSSLCALNSALVLFRVAVILSLHLHRMSLLNSKRRQGEEPDRRRQRSVLFPDDVRLV